MASIGSSLLGSRSEKRAVNQGAQQAQQQVQQGFDYARQSPIGTQYLPAGAAANAAQAELLGLNPDNYLAGPQASAEPDWDAYLKTPAGRMTLDKYRKQGHRYRAKFGINSPQELAAYEYQLSGGDAGPMGEVVRSISPQPQEAGGPAAGGGGGAQSAFENYLQSTGHQFRLNRGMASIEGSRAAAGALNSGATLRALQEYGQELGTADFQNYLGNLQGLSKQGLAAGQTIASAGSSAGAQGAQIAYNRGAANADINAARNAGIVGGAGAIGQGVVNYFANRPQPKIVKKP